MTEKFTDCMIDFETLGLAPDSKTMQFGWVFFNRRGDKKMVGASRFFDLEEQEALGRTELKSTVEFWKRQPTALYQKMQSGDKTVEQILRSYVKSWNKYARPNTWLWSKGASFDQPILTGLFDEVVSLSHPAHYANSRCVRTLGALFPEEKHLFAAQQAHDAKSDCIAQVRTVRSIYEDNPNIK